MACVGNNSITFYHLEWIDGDRHSQVRWQTVARGHDKPTRMGVAIAIDPFQGYTLGAYLKMMGPQCLDDLNT